MIKIFYLSAIIRLYLQKRCYILMKKGGDNMELTPEYLTLFNAITTTIEEMERSIERLKLVQQAAEELFISG